jgi:hypothetical protein
MVFGVQTDQFARTPARLILPLALTIFSVFCIFLVANVVSAAEPSLLLLTGYRVGLADYTIPYHPSPGERSHEQVTETIFSVGVAKYGAIHTMAVSVTFLRGFSETLDYSRIQGDFAVDMPFFRSVGAGMRVGLGSWIIEYSGDDIRDTDVMGFVVAQPYVYWTMSNQRDDVHSPFVFRLEAGLEARGMSCDELSAAASAGESGVSYEVPNFVPSVGLTVLF